MPRDPTDRLTLQQIHLLVPHKEREGKYQCPRCHKWNLTIDSKTSDFNCWFPECQGKASEIAALIWAEVKRRAEKATSVGSDPPDGAPAGSLRLAEYGLEKHLSPQLLIEWFGLREGKHPYYDKIDCAVCFPYYDGHGNVVTEQWRWNMDKNSRRLLKDKPTYLYGGHFLELLEKMATTEDRRLYIFLPEGESNTQTLAQIGLPALGRPGARTWKDEWTNLKCLQAAEKLYIPLDMKDGKPEDVAILGARRIAECFPPGKVLALKPPAPHKDVSAMWIFHTEDEVFGGGEQGFRKELERAILAAKPIIPEKEDVDGIPPDLGAVVLSACPLLKDFVELTLPEVESDVNTLICGFLACAGAALGLKAHAKVAHDIHHAATYHLLIADTASGKGTAFNCADKLFETAVPDWAKIKHASARSQQALYRMLRNVSTEQLKTEDGELAANPRYAEGRLLLRFSEVSAVFKSMRAEWSTMSQALRETYDGKPVSNERADEQESIRVDDPYALSLLGDVTPWELQEVIEGVDFANGVANRFIWCSARRAKTLPHGGRPPDYTELAKRLNRMVIQGQLGEITYSETGQAAWDAWIETLPLEDSGKLGSACGRSRANALRLAVLFTVLDETRDMTSSPRIETRHVHAATSIIDRHRETVAWFLGRPAGALPKAMGESDKSALWRKVEKLRGAVVNGKITDTEMHRLFSNNLTAAERKVIAEAAGLRADEEVDAKGNKIVVWGGSA